MRKLFIFVFSPYFTDRGLKAVESKQSSIYRFELYAELASFKSFSSTSAFDSSMATSAIN